ncbi:16579_t:CDS:1, partial [Gigaspora rosea]
VFELGDSVNQIDTKNESKNESAIEPLKVPKTVKNLKDIKKRKALANLEINSLAKLKALYLSLAENCRKFFNK